MSSTNPDSRPLPSGWITQYDDSHKAWFYVDTNANPPTPTWTHPQGPPPANPSHSGPHHPYKQSSHGTLSSGTAGSYVAAPAEPQNPDARPLPAGWISQYDENHKAWFYVDTHANPPTPSWVHPLGPPPTSPPPVPSQAPAPTHTSSPPPVNPGEPENPDKRPLPVGWIQQYHPEHKAFFYVDTNSPNAIPVWTHPLGSPPVSPWPHIGATTSPAPTPAKVALPAKVASPPPQPAASGEPENPDKRPLPTGWIQQYDPGYKAFFYVNTADLNPTPSWTHPLGPPPASAGPQPTPGPASSAPYKAASPPPQTVTPGQPENPDKRPMPTGWIQQYDSNHKAWFYVDTTVPNPSPTWVHPLGPPAASPPPATQSSSFGPQVPTNPGEPTNPDKRPLPTGWIDQYDPGHKAWFYVDTTAPNPAPSWTHPLGPPPTSPTPTSASTPAPHAPTGPQNPDTRALPPGWVSEYDPARSTWFYVDTTKNPPAATWTHPLGPAPMAPPSGGYNPSAPTTPYGQPAYGGGAPQQHKQGKDPLGGLLGGLLGGKGGGRASKYLGGVSSGLQNITGKYGGGNQGPPGAGPWPGQPQPPYGAPPYGGPPGQGSHPTPGQY